MKPEPVQRSFQRNQFTRPIEPAQRPLDFLHQRREKSESAIERFLFAAIVRFIAGSR
jgi:hypothetical protein